MVFEVSSFQTASTVALLLTLLAIQVPTLVNADCSSHLCYNNGFCNYTSQACTCYDNFFGAGASLSSLVFHSRFSSASPLLPPPPPSPLPPLPLPTSPPPFFLLLPNRVFSQDAFSVVDSFVLVFLFCFRWLFCSRQFLLLLSSFFFLLSS